jgi:riboflavin kinase/FMN adenylyltransferase
MRKYFMHLNATEVTTIAIGGFDGIHRGHQQLIKHLGPKGALLVIDKDAANLTPGSKRSDYSKYPCMFYHFSKLKNLTGPEFIKLLYKLFPKLETIVVGYDFRFGANRAHGAKDLRQLFPGKVIIVEEYCFDGISVHSSTIRNFIKEGNIAQANRLLGREYAIIGDIIQGQGLGKKSLYPTLNLDVKNFLLPKEGVYATRTFILDKVYESVSFIGVRESTDGGFAVETHILDVGLEKTPTHVELFFVEFLRENKKFDDLQLLKKEITKDIQKAKEVLRTCKVYFSTKDDCHYPYLTSPQRAG